MEILDGKRHDKAAQPFHLSRIVGLLNGAKYWGWLSDSDAAKNYQPEQIEKADALFAETVRALVDQWIDSGKNAEGIESPLSRNVNTVPPGYTQPLFDVLYAWLNRGNWPSFSLMRSGKIAINSEPPHLQIADKRGLAKYREPEEYANDCAFFYFKELLDTPGAHRVGRCNNPDCRRYYIRRRLRKAEIKRGAYCGQCTGVGSVARTKISRETAKQRLVSLAADYWDAWTQTRRNPERADWVAKQVSKRSTVSITGKWAIRNLKAIEIELERRKHAES